MEIVKNLIIIVAIKLLIDVLWVGIEKGYKKIKKLIESKNENRTIHSENRTIHTE